MEVKTIDPKECTRWSLADRSGFEFGDLHNLAEDINPSWYETKLKCRQHKGYKGFKVSHRALQI